VAEEKAEIEAVLRRVEETLLTARHGFDDMTGRNRSRRFSGLRNIIVFGRSVTFVLQNLRSVVEGGNFDRWYEPKQEKMKADPLMRYFVEARNEILKQGKIKVSTSGRVESFSSDDIQKLGTPPPGAKAFFLGDQL
jgi:hypothetical protein